MRLDEILNGLDGADVSGDAHIDITGISYDSRKVKPGDLFVAVKGENADGHDFIADAVKRGAVAIAYENPALPSYMFNSDTKVRTTGPGTVSVCVKDSRAA